MSNLWQTAAAFQLQAMPWKNQYPRDRAQYHPISVRHAGFAGLVGDQDWEDEMHEASGEAPHEEFDENLWDDTSPEPTTHENRHYEEHGEYPESLDERHDQAYGEAVDKKRGEDRLDHDDPAMMGFVREHASNTKLWHDYGRLGKVNLRQPVWATQSHVAREHIDRFKNNPNDTAFHRQMYPDSPEYMGNEHPMFVTHHGRLHCTEGHHRVAAALERGDKEITAHHFNLDEHPQFEYGEGADD